MSLFLFGNRFDESAGMEPGIGGLETFGSDDNYVYSHDDYIARGAFGLIYKGKRKKVKGKGKEGLEEPVAIKVVHLFSEDTEESLIKHRNRLKRLVEMKHENLVAYHKIVLTKLPGGPRVELTMDFYEERDLACLLKSLQENKHALNLDTAIHYAQEIARGLMFLHEHDIIHGDLKPQNVLVRKLGQHLIRLAIGDLDDFVQMQQSATCSLDITSFRGTIRYMSPEMLRRMVQNPEENPGRKTDIWSLGCIMLELADCLLRNSKKWLRKGEQMLENGSLLTNADFIKNVIDGYVPHLSDLTPEGLAVCIEICLCTASRDRANANGVLDMLDAATRSAKRSVILLYENLVGERQIEILEISLRQFCQTLASERRCAHLRSRLRYLAMRHEYQHEPTWAVESNSSVYVFQNCGGWSPEPFFLDFNVIQWSIRQATSVDCFLNNRIAWKNVSMNAVIPVQAICPIALGSKIYFFARYKDLRGRMFLVEADTDKKLIRSVFGLWKKLECSATATTATRYGKQIIYLTTSGTGSWMGAFDTVTEQWESLPPLQSKRVNYASVALHGCVYVLGGASQSHRRRKSSCHRYLVASRTWEKVNDLVNRRKNHCAFVINSRLCVYGGYDDLENSGVQPMEVYDAERDGWSEVAIERPLIFGARSTTSCRTELRATRCAGVSADDLICIMDKFLHL